jgi:hypothetical protein
MTGPFFATRSDLESAFDALAEELNRQGITATVAICGGAAMLLTHPNRPATRDIDAIEIDSAVSAAVRKIAKERRWPPTWLNDQAAMYAPRSPKLSTRAAYDRLGLRILTMHPEQLLAMKVMASRPRDVEDIRRLVTDLGITEVDEVIELTRRAFPEELLPDRAETMIAEALTEHEGAAALAAGSRVQVSETGRDICGRTVKATGRPCLLQPRHRGRCRSIL